MAVSLGLFIFIQFQKHHISFPGYCKGDLRIYQGHFVYDDVCERECALPLTEY